MTDEKIHYVALLSCLMVASKGKQEMSVLEKWAYDWAYRQIAHNEDVKEMVCRIAKIW